MLFQEEGEAQICPFLGVGQIAAAYFLDAPDAVYKRVAMQEQQTPAFLGIAVVVEVNLQRMKEIRLVFAVVFGKPVECWMQQPFGVHVALDGSDQGVKLCHMRGLCGFRFR